MAPDYIKRITFDRKPGSIVNEKLVQRLRARGAGNKIVVNEGAKLGSIKIDFMGRNNLIEIGERVSFKGGHVRANLLLLSRIKDQRRVFSDSICSVEMKKFRLRWIAQIV